MWEITTDDNRVNFIWPIDNSNNTEQPNLVVPNIPTTVDAPNSTFGDDIVGMVTEGSSGSGGNPNNTTAGETPDTTNNETGSSDNTTDTTNETTEGNDNTTDTTNETSGGNDNTTDTTNETTGGNDNTTDTTNGTESNGSDDNTTDPNDGGGIIPDTNGTTPGDETVRDNSTITAPAHYNHENITNNIKDLPDNPTSE